MSYLEQLQAIDEIPCVIIESPYGLLTPGLAVAYARRALADSLARGEAPFASHLLYTQVLDDTDPEQRALGLARARAWYGFADAVVVYEDHGISEGMRLGMLWARELLIDVIYREIGKGPS